MKEVIRSTEQKFEPGSGIECAMSNFPTEAIQTLLVSRGSTNPEVELTLEMAEQAIAAIKGEYDKLASAEEDENGLLRVKEGDYLVSKTVTEKGFDFFAAALRKSENNAVLVSVYRSMEAGAKPAILTIDDSGKFALGETFKKTLPARANCVYDSEAEQLVGKENCNGNAVDQSTAMGIPLMTPEMGQRHFTRFDDRSKYCYDYLQASDEDRKQGCAPCLYRGDGLAGVYLGNARYHRADQGWRGALWVQS